MFKNGNKISDIMIIDLNNKNMDFKKFNISHKTV